jgi:hypothetical protein
MRTGPNFVPSSLLSITRSRRAVTTPVPGGSVSTVPSTAPGCPRLPLSLAQLGRRHRVIAEDLLDLRNYPIELILRITTDLSKNLADVKKCEG